MNKQDELKLKIYKSISDYISYLDDELHGVTTEMTRYKIEKELKSLRLDLKRYYVPTTLENSNYQLVKSIEKRK